MWLGGRGRGGAQFRMQKIFRAKRTTSPMGACRQPAEIQPEPSNNNNNNNNNKSVRLRDGRYLN